MKELSFIETIKNTLACSSYLGDDCAFLEDLDIFVTHDTLVENVHFSMYTTSAYLLGRKSISVNLSDLAAALSIPKYDICVENNVKVVGGDITSADKIVISICAIGKKISQHLSGRCFAKKDDYIITTGNYGSSSAGFYAFSNFLYCEENLKKAHLNPIARVNEARELALLIDSNIAVMDTSDGLVDALYKIALASKHSVEIDFANIPVSSELLEFSKRNTVDYKQFVKWGGEDFELVACVDEEVYSKLDRTKFTCIGRVLNKDFAPSVIINYGTSSERITKEIFEKNSYNHF